jgi:phosphoglycerate dehydrogenase-like enzyme
MLVKVHLLQSYKPEWIEELRDRLDENIQVTTGAQIPSPPDYHILVSGRPNRDFLEASPNLHTVIIPWAGLPDGGAALLREFPHVSLHNLHHNAIATAETALALLFAAAKHTMHFDRKLRMHDWRRHHPVNPAILLDGKTVLVLGYGSVGQHVAKGCRGMGMQVLGVRRNPLKPILEDWANEVHPLEAMHDLLPRANVLMITLPLTDETRGLIGERELSLLKKPTVLVNVGRGPIIDQGALYRALRDGVIHAAGLDVWYNYPAGKEARANTPPSDFPFHELENVVMSPHRGGGAMEIEEFRLTHLVNSLNAAARGGEIPNRVDLNLGY